MAKPPCTMTLEALNTTPRKPSGDLLRRAVVFLEDPSRKYVNIVNAFDRFDGQVKQIFSARFDNWTQGNVGNNQYHGFAGGNHDKNHRYCFVFKWKTNRLYGFLTNSSAYPRLRVCVLLIHATKTRRETDKTELDRAYKCSKDIEVLGTLEWLLRRTFN